MGLPIKRFIAANNRNDVFLRYLNTGEYNPGASIPTIANAMDVGEPSNFARILDLYGNDHAAIKADISGCSYTDDQIRSTMREVYDSTGYILDPHGATACRALGEQLLPGEKGIFLETAHPAKFNDTVEDAIGARVQIPSRLAAFMRGEKSTVRLSRQFPAFKKFLPHRYSNRPYIQNNHCRIAYMPSLSDSCSNAAVVYLYPCPFRICSCGGALRHTA